MTLSTKNVIKKLNEFIYVCVTQTQTSKQKNREDEKELYMYIVIKLAKNSYIKCSCNDLCILKLILFSAFRFFLL